MDCPTRQSRHRRRALLAVAAGTLSPASPFVRSALAQQARPSATVEIEFTQAGLLVSAGWGEARLRFQGRTYRYRVRGLGVGGLGISRLRATGTVHGLTRVDDFAGTYVQARAGLVAGAAEVPGAIWLANTAGVTMQIRPRREGVALNVGADGLLIEPR